MIASYIDCCSIIPNFLSRMGQWQSAISAHLQLKFYFRQREWQVSLTPDNGITRCGHIKRKEHETAQWEQLAIF